MLEEKEWTYGEFEKEFSELLEYKRKVDKVRELTDRNLEEEQIEAAYQQLDDEEKDIYAAIV